MDYTAIIEALDARTLDAFQAWGETFAGGLKQQLAERDALIAEQAKAVASLAAQVAEFSAAVREARAEIEATQKRVREAVSAELARAPIPTYKGVFDREADYQAGDMVTHKGSVWHCNAAVAGEAPGASSTWTLAVKCGRDGKDLRAPEGAAE